MSKRLKAIVSVIAVVVIAGGACIWYKTRENTKVEGSQDVEIVEDNSEEEDNSSTVEESKNDEENVENVEDNTSNESSDTSSNNTTNKVDNGTSSESNTNTDNNTQVTVESSDVISRQFILKNGTGDLIIYNETDTSYKFTISGANDGDDKKIDETTGIAEVSDGLGTYTRADGSKITFQANGSSMLVTTYDANGNTDFIGAYLPSN